MSKIVTVITTTYNRAHTLTSLYNSLINQSNLEFDWIIVDDGSTDNTRELVSKWINEDRISLRFYQKQNGGKHTALNFSYQFIQTPLTFIVDSDDTLTENSIQTIVDKYREYMHIENICGYSFLRGKPEGGLLSYGTVPQEGLIETFCECRINRGIGGDMAEVWVTECLKEYPFPEFKDEKFLGEDIVWIKMSEKYKMVFFNIVIYISDYQEDGLTKSRRRHNINSPKGCVERAKTFIEADIKLKYKIKAILQYQIYGRFAKYHTKYLFKHCPYKIIYIGLYFPSLILYKKWKNIN